MNIDELLSASNDFTAYVKACKAALKLAIEGKGVAVGESDLLSTYANKVASITGGGSETIFTVTFFDYDGITVLKTQDVLQGGDVNPPANPSRDGYTFTGWSASSFNVQADLTIVAQYTYSPNLIALLDYDLSLIELQNLATGSDIIAENPSNANMTFTGWSDSLLNVQGNRALIAEYDTNPASDTYVELLLTQDTGLTHTFNFFKSVSGSSIAVYFGDGTFGYLPNVNDATITHTYPGYGSYTVKIRTTDTYGALCGNPGLNNPSAKRSLLDGDSAKAVIRAFEGSKNLFGAHCFQNCLNMVGIIFFSSKTGIGQRLIYNCQSLRGVVLPSTIVTITGDTTVTSVFEGCASLERLVFLGQVPTFPGNSMANIPSGCIIYVPDNYVNDYQLALSSYNYTIQGLSTLPNSYVV